MPILKDPSEGIWARLATADAGDGYGSFFIPNVNDEVVLGFFNDDPRDPVVLGSLYGKNIAPAITPTEDNFERGYISPNQLKIMLNDETGAITLETPESNKVELLDDTSADGGGITLTDKHGNSITMNKDGVKITSKGNLEMEATGDFTLKADGKVETKGSETTIDSGATTTVKGGQVVVSGNRIELN